ncbi:hypothetical protein N7466_010211 [Penicillium verhagenii]|uniref:uncharacterized protein n=1 Tax=Penicillium verhagenii TaxID=1562060 RepID=UPI002544DD7E|nr:uncharacterized protein N7466_010211 [Penicillium verhagenii]KAJ5919268.1 hypothetical protein N7466_010211 [Penicillium verhagenii]
MAAKHSTQSLGTISATDADDQKPGNETMAKVSAGFLGSDSATDSDDQKPGNEMMAKVSAESLGSDSATDSDDQNPGNDMMVKVSAESLGSGSWLEVDDQKTDDDLDLRDITFLEGIKWDVLASICSRLRDGISCEIDGKYCSGSNNIVRRVSFVDGVSWVARLRLPNADMMHGAQDALDVASTLKVEVSTMKFLNFDPTNEVGAPYILMDYIHGTIAADLRSQTGDGILFGTPSQDRRFRQQMADIQVQLSSLTFDKIGCIYENEETSEFYIGREVETGQGPWESAMDFYKSYGDHSLSEYRRRGAEDCASMAVPALFQILIRLYREQNTNGGPFRLVNRDFGAHNLLVNENFEIISVIDFEEVMAAPMEAVAQYPVLTDLDRAPPGYVATEPFVIKRIMETAPKIQEYNEFIKAAEVKMKIDRDGNTPISNLMISDVSSIFQGIMDYRYHSQKRNDRWTTAYLMLFEKKREEMGGLSIAI